MRFQAIPKAIQGVQTPRKGGKLDLDASSVVLQPVVRMDALQSTVILLVLRIQREKALNSLIFDAVHVIFYPCRR